MSEIDVRKQIEHLIASVNGLASMMPARELTEGMRSLGMDFGVILEVMLARIEKLEGQLKK